MKTVVSERGQIVIPKPLRDRLGLLAGQILECTEEGGRLIAVKAEDRKGVDAAYGILRGVRADDAIARLRGAPDATRSPQGHARRRRA